ncbi:MAG: DNA mismatch repair endonuclease MutL [Anaerolineae bacterium]|nr:DNA mismatch repair endonuclease MutL [Anaerolineae bacterium]
MMTIQILPDDVISQIAAGEVVERPASVVKELIENALDAGATHLHIEVVAGGQKRIRISDDGAGILSDEVILALTRHATSKLRSATDLQHLRTLGFRGEALSSIAAVSHTMLITRHRDESVGTQIRIEGGHIVNEKPIGAPAGTVLTIENLFYNTPARLKFLKSETTEKRNINAIVMNYAMAYPTVRFVLVHDGREIFRSGGSGQLADVVVKVLGLDYFKEMIEVEGEERIRETGDSITVTGFVSQPSLHRKDRTRIILFVNGRVVQDSGLTYAVTQAYHNLLDKGRNPYAVLMISVPTDFVDVNVHPTKAEVRFQNTNVVFSAVQRAVRQGVIGFSQSERHSHYAAHEVSTTGSAWALPYDRNRQMDMEMPLDELAHAGTIHTGDDIQDIPEGIGRPEKPRTLPLLRVVGQIGAAYIVAEGPAGLYLIDQHAAHTRVLYQELTELLGQQEQMPQRQIESQTIDVTTNEAKILEKHLEILEKLGFVLEAFGVSTFLIRGIPAILKTGDITQHVWSLLEILAEKSSSPLQDRLLIHIAAQAAVKAGQLLNEDDMKSLVRKLERCPDPLSSPNGQATLIHMSADQLQRQFMRGNN